MALAAGADQKGWTVAQTGQPIAAKAARADKIILQTLRAMEAPA